MRDIRDFIIILYQLLKIARNDRIGESWGMANDGEWRTPHFQQKWKREHNENSLWQLLFIHSLVVCSDLGNLPKFCSENFQKKQVNDFVYFSALTLIEQCMQA